MRCKYSLWLPMLTAILLCVHARGFAETPPQVGFNFVVTDDWGGGFVAEMSLTNHGDSAIEGWELGFDYSGSVDGVWNCEVLAQDMNRLILGPLSYNTRIDPGATVNFGMQGSPGGISQPTGVSINGQAVTENPQPMAEVSISNTAHRRGLTGGEDGVAAGYFATDGNRIVDANGQAVRIAGVSWFGLESETLAPHGLWARNYQSMMDQMVELGFNTIRLPFCNELFDPGKTPQSINYSLNPDLQGLVGVELIDAIVNYAGEIGLRILLDHHRNDAGVGALGKDLWYTDEYPESRWIADWEMLAQRYLGNPTVIGADLHNEPHGPATWGSGDPATDWRLAAERCGNAILAINPDWLIVVEGVASYQGEAYWWGGNLQGVRDHPVRLDLPNRLVYSPHAYPNSIYAQPWFSAPDFPENLFGIWDQMWGYIYREGIAPVILGEWGSFFEDPKDLQWLDKMKAYLQGDWNEDGTPDIPPGDPGISWIWWSWNPNSGDTGGILASDWQTPVQVKLDYLQELQFPLAEAGSWPPLAESTRVNLNITLSAPAAEDITVHWQTEDGTALAGRDYEQAAGSVVITTGTSSAQVEIDIMPGNSSSPEQSWFFVDLTAIDGDAQVGQSRGQVTLYGSGSPYPEQQTYVDWSETYFSDTQLADPEVSAPNADPTASGVPNLLRMSFGLEPWQNVAAGDLPALESTANGLILSYREANDVMLIIEESFNLIDWQPVTGAEITRHSEGDHQRVSAVIPAVDTATHFIRLRAPWNG